MVKLEKRRVQHMLLTEVSPLKLKIVRTRPDPWHPETYDPHTDNIRSKVRLFRDQEKHNDQDRQHWEQKQ